MRSAIKLAARKLGSSPPVPLARPAGISSANVFNLGAGRQDRETLLRTYGRSGTVFSIIALLAQSTASVRWHLFKKQPQDARRRYSTGDAGSDQRVEVVQHAALSLWNDPNDFHSNYEFQEGAAQHLELTGETFWVVDRSGTSFPTAMWYVRPDRMEPVPGTDTFLAGWVYNGPDGEKVPLDVSQVILEKTPDPLDPFRGSGPVQSIMPNIDQQRYATEYMRNLFLNSATPGGLITVQNALTDTQWNELTDRWRETHLGVSRAGRVGVLENGATWADTSKSNKDLEYGQLRLANRDELREAWRIHKAMMGSSDDVNRANAQTSEEIFVTWQTLPRLERRRNTLNSKLLPMFGASAQGTEFDFEDPSPVNAESTSFELINKATAAQHLVDAGYDPHDVLETVGLPDMSVVEQATQSPALPAGWVAEQVQQPSALSNESNGFAGRGVTGIWGGPSGGASGVTDTPARRRESTRLTDRSDAAKAYQLALKSYPPAAVAWVLHATWTGPVKVPETHIDPDMSAFDSADPNHVADFTKMIRAGKKIPPVLLVKRPGHAKLLLVDGHHRYAASVAEGKKVPAFVATVDADDGPWQTMHTHQMDNKFDLAGLSEYLVGSLTQLNGHARME